MKFIPKRLRGFAIVSAIFILVVLAALGAFIVNISSNQQIGSALDVQGVRAYQAARAGIEWGLFERLQDAWVADPTVPTEPCSPTVTSSFAFPAAATTFSGFTVTVTCTASVDANNGPTVTLITATACNQPNAGACPNTAPTSALYIERRIDVAL